MLKSSLGESETMPWVIAAAAVVGAVAGSMKSGPDQELNDLGQQAMSGASDSLKQYSALVKAGPGEAEYKAGIQSQKDMADLYKRFQTSGMYDMQQGNQLAEQQYGSQRQLLQMSFQDQLAQANRAAALQGRNSNDPILRARLAQDQNRMLAGLNAEQAQAAMGYGRQSVSDQLTLAGNRSDVLSSLGNQALVNRSNLFQMSSAALMGQQQNALQTAVYEQSRGGGVKGMLTGMMAGAGTGAKIAGGMGGGGGGGGGDGGGYSPPPAQMPASQNSVAAFQNTGGSSYGYGGGFARAPAGNVGGGGYTGSYNVFNNRGAQEMGGGNYYSPNSGGGMGSNSFSWK